jgi:hypothetical protein
VYIDDIIAITKEDYEHDVTVLHQGPERLKKFKLCLRKGKRQFALKESNIWALWSRLKVLHLRMSI